MHSSRGEKHISGAERLLDFSQLEDAASEMLRRALRHPRGAAEKITLTLQPLEREQVLKEPLLKLSTLEVDDWQQGRKCASERLEAEGLNPSIISAAMAQLAAGAAPGGGTMRGAMLIDAATGQRLETDRARGVRVSRMDVDPAARVTIELLLNEQALVNPRVLEAWVLASKVALYPQIIAELCWSDDPDYLTGYVASARNGYQRITRLKESGSEIGGRIFFVRPATEMVALSDCLQHEPVLFGAPITDCS
jgi:6-carboxyhexanoate--CoA ligase